MILKRRHERICYGVLLLAWLLLLGIYGEAIAAGLGLIPDPDTFGIRYLLVMVLFPIVLMVIAGTCLATLAVLVAGGWVQRIRVLLWFALLYGFSALAGVQAFGLRGRATIGSLGLGLLLGLLVYWLSHPVALDVAAEARKV